MRSTRTRCTAMAGVAAAALLAAVVPAWAPPAAAASGVTEAVAAINAACAATQPLAETGLRVTDAGEVVAAYNPAAGVVQQAWDGPRSGLVLTASPPTLYREIPIYGAAFARRALKSLGVTATWTVDPTPAVQIADAIPSPGELIRQTLAAPRAAIPPVTQCAGTLLANPKRGTVIVQRTDDASGTAWRVVAGADYFGLDNDYENGVLLVIHVNPQGSIDRVERGWASSDGFSSLAQDLRWEYGVQPAITVPPTTSTVDADRLLAARASFITSDLRAIARTITRRPLPAATQRALFDRVYDSILPSSQDPMFPSGVRRTGSSFVVWQRDTATGTVQAIRFSRVGNGKQVGATKVAGFRP